jgi:hypothetical protein
MKPSVGRIVHFRSPDRNEALDLLCNGGRCVAAIIVGVKPDGGVTLDVRLPFAFLDHRSIMLHDVPEGAEPGQWHWPERVE